MQPTFDRFQTAISHHQAGRLDQAITLYQQILREQPDHADALHLLGVTAQQRGQTPQAIELIERAITLNDSPAYRSNLAEAYRSIGDLTRAESHVRHALERDPRHAEASHNLGLILAQSDRDDEAIPYFEAAIEAKPFWQMPFLHLGMLHEQAGRPLDALAIYREGVRLSPGFARLHYQLSVILLAEGHPEDALIHAREAVRLRPDQPEALIHLGNVLATLGQIDQARAAYEQALQLRPDAAEIFHRLGQLEMAIGRFEQALEQFDHAIRLHPNNALFHAHRGGVLRELERPDDAITAYQQAITLNPTHADLHNALGFLLQHEGRMVEALNAYQASIRVQPDHADTHLNMGILYYESGEKHRAVECFREALRHQPDHPEALGGLALSLRAKLDATEEALAEQVIAARRIPERRRAILLYGMAQVRDARQQYDRAAALAREANAIYAAEDRKMNRGYSPDEHRAYVDQIIRAYSPAYFERTRGWGVESDRPIFVLGLPRSGTSLIEQILASHPDVFGAGELESMRSIYRTIPDLVGMSAPGIECVDRLDRDAIQTLANRYLAGLTELNSSARLVVDKMPDNYLLIGLIATLLPHARIVHTRRDVRDVGLSCWLTHFQNIRWARDLTHIGHRIREYRRLMDHWREVLPGRLIEIDYEAVVDDLEGQTRSLLQACGLSWHADCLKFHETSRVVRTASMAQVREPIYRSSVQRWRHYQTHLGPLLELT